MMSRHDNNNESQQQSHLHCNKICDFITRIIVWLICMFYTCTSILIAFGILFSQNTNNANLPTQCDGLDISSWLITGSIIHLILAFPLSLSATAIVYCGLEYGLILVCVCIMNIPASIGIWAIATSYTEVSSFCMNALRLEAPIIWKAIVGYAVLEVVSIAALLSGLIFYVVCERKKIINFWCNCRNKQINARVNAQINAQINSQNSDQSLILSEILTVTPTPTPTLILTPTHSPIENSTHNLYLNKNMNSEQEIQLVELRL